MVRVTAGILCFCALVACPQPRATATYCGGYSYARSYYTYPSYTTPSVQTNIYNKTTFVPIASFYPYYVGAAYVGPPSLAAYSQQTTTTATTSGGGIAVTPASNPAAISASDFARLTKIVESGFSGLRSDMVAMEGRFNARIGNLEGRLQRAELRQSAIEQKLGMPSPGPGGGGVAPPAPTPAPVPAPRPPDRPTPKPGDDPAPEKRLPDSLTVLKNKCAACHQEGNEARGKKLVLLDKDGKRAPLTADQLLGLNEVLKEGRMPPAPKIKDGKPDHNIPGLTEAEMFALLLDVKSFPRRE